uniref:Jacalin-type lectin domain-containing protein n=1 Tax=Ornithorhynchus anatinus TaxID=9258 RepID=F7DYT9_ORNAN
RSCFWGRGTVRCWVRHSASRSQPAPRGRPPLLLPAAQQAPRRRTSPRVANTPAHPPWKTQPISQSPYYPLPQCRRVNPPRGQGCCLGSLICFPSSLPGQTQLSSFSGPYGTVGGISFSFSGDHLQGTITGLRVREQPGGVIRGIQLQFGGTWSKYYGAEIEVIHEFLLLPGETITQVSGKYLVYIQQLIFITSKGRQFHVGQPAGTSFNALTHRPSASLRYISGQHNGAGLTNIGFHWEINEWS